MKLWKFVFGFSTFLFVIDLVRFPFRSNLEFMDFIWLIFNGFSLFPLYGFAYKITVGSKRIAIAIFAVNALLFLAALLLGSFFLYAQPSIPAFVGAAIAFVIFGIYLYPQFMYAFKSDTLWRENT